MLIVLGNKIAEISKKEFSEKVKYFQKVIIDLGTGDGRFIFKSALHKRENFYIGIDPSIKPLKLFSKKAVRKNLANIFFLVGSIERLPQDLRKSADKIFIVLPWGSLLKNIVVPSRETIMELVDLLKKEGEIEIILGYSPDFEPSETKRLELPELNEDYLRKMVLPIFESCDLYTKNFKQINQDELNKFETTWSKKLSFGKERKIFQLLLKKHPK